MRQRDNKGRFIKSSKSEQKHDSKGGRKRDSKGRFIK